ncbi:MAG: MBL fold metallo-hydrolase [Clostridia bacterium]|nr:MBL fold metallo-hydrolase [Clostridia bacterium]
MLIQHIGHAEFLITLESGFRVVTDPYDASTGYPVQKIEADGVLVSHHHHDHDAVENVTGHPQIIDYAGLHTFAPDVKVTGILADHDDAEGAKRGKTLLFLLEAEDLRVAHLGDLGCLLDADQLEALGQVDILMLPVGGFFTIDAAQAKEVIDQLDPRIVIPMHYKTEYNADWPIGPVEDFTGLFDPAQVRKGGQALRVTRGDLACQPRIVVL